MPIESLRKEIARRGTIIDKEIMKIEKERLEPIAKKYQDKFNNEYLKLQKEMVNATEEDIEFSFSINHFKSI